MVELAFAVRLATSPRARRQANADADKDEGKGQSEHSGHYAITGASLRDGVEREGRNQRARIGPLQRAADRGSADDCRRETRKQITR